MARCPGKPPGADVYFGDARALERVRTDAQAVALDAYLAGLGAEVREALLRDQWALWAERGIDAANCAALREGRR